MVISKKEIIHLLPSLNMCICLFSLVSYFLCMYKMLYTPDIMHFVSWNTFASMFYGKRMREHSSSLSYLAFINAFTNIYNMPGTLLWTVVSTVVDADAVSVPQFNLQSRDSYRLRNWLLYYNFKTRCQRWGNESHGNTKCRISARPLREATCKVWAEGWVEC